MSGLTLQRSGMTNPEIEAMDETQYLANWTLNEYKANREMGELTAYDYMAKLGCNFVNLEFEKVDPYQLDALNEID